MNKFNNIIKVAAILVLSGFVSCVEMEDPHAGAVGYLAAPSLDVDVTVDNLVLTKAAPVLPTVQEPDAEGVTFIVREKGSDADLLGGKPWTSALTLDAGKTYVVEAYYGENGFEGPCFAGSDEITIEPLVTATPDLTLTLSNALLCVTTDALDEHFTVTKIELVSGKRSSVTKSEDNIIYTDSGEQIHTISGQVEDKWIWVPADKPLKVKVQGLNAAGNNASFEYDDLIPSAGTAYNLICGRPAENQWPSVKWTEIPLRDGAFEQGLYFKSAEASNMSTENAASLKYQIIGGDYLEWKDVTPEDVEGYKYLSGLANGTEYKLRAYVGNIFSPEQSFVPVTYASCLATDVTAAHNNADNPSAMLESTAVEAEVKATLPAIIAELATTHKASVTFGNGRVEQSTLKVNESKQTLSNADGWPYLPQGSYAYTAVTSLSLPGDRTITADLSGSVTVPAPVFEVFINAYTSYDKYEGTNGNAKNVSAANSVPDAATMYDISGGARIAVSLLDNTNYGEKDFKFTMYHYDTKVTDNLSSLKAVSGFGVNVATIGNKSGLSWAQHDLTVSMTFDGVTVTKTNQHHITGLPYSYNFVDGSLDQYRKDGWTLNGQLRSSNIALSGRESTLVLQHQSAFGADKQNGFVVSPRFYAPNQISVEPSIHRSTYTSSGNKERTGYIGVVSNTTTSNTTSITYKTKGGNSPKGTVYGKDEWIDGELNLTSSAPYISIDSDDWTSGGWDAVYYFLHEVHLRYAE